MPFFSIIIPCFNVEDTVEKTISSVLNQTFESYEIIAVNDGSTDNTLEILKTFADKPFFKIISQENKGLGAARNFGIKNSNGRYICLLDADDLWIYDRLQKIYDYIQKFNPELLSNDEIIYQDDKKNSYLINKPPNNLLSLFLGGNTLSPSAMTIEKSVFYTIGYFLEDKVLLGVEDWDYWLRVFEKNKYIHYLSEPLGIYRKDIKNMSKDLDFHEKVYQIFILHGEYLLNEGKLSRKEFEIGKSFIYLRRLFKNIFLIKNYNFYFGKINLKYFRFVF